MTTLFAERAAAALTKAGLIDPTKMGIAVKLISGAVTQTPTPAPRAPRKHKQVPTPAPRKHIKVPTPAPRKYKKVQRVVEEIFRQNNIYTKEELNKFTITKLYKLTKQQAPIHWNNLKCPRQTISGHFQKLLKGYKIYSEDFAKKKLINVSREN